MSLSIIVLVKCKLSMWVIHCIGYTDFMNCYCSKRFRRKKQCTFPSTNSKFVSLATPSLPLIAKDALGSRLLLVRIGIKRFSKTEWSSRDISRCIFDRKFWFTLVFWLPLHSFLVILCCAKIRFSFKSLVNTLVKLNIFAHNCSHIC